MIVLVIGGEFLIRGAIPLVVRMKVSMVVVGLTVVSFATSAPELIVSVYSALIGHSDIALGNVIGSNIFNIFAVLGITSMIQPIHVVDQGLIHNDIWWMFGAALLLHPLMFLFHKGHIGRIEGSLLFLFYSTYIILLF